jgi:hypothetical protein
LDSPELKQEAPSENIAPDTYQASVDQLKISHDFIALKKRISSLAEMNPLTLTIEAISNLPKTINPVPKEELTLPPESKDLQEKHRL